MPIYEYRCLTCAHTFEVLVRSAREEREAACPACGERRIERQLSTFAAPTSGSLASPRGGACGRCGDPAGPCAAAE